MALTCRRCGRDNPAGFAFCGFCTAPLGDRVIREERRTVTVLFCDLVGFTAASEHADPEDVIARLDPYFERLRRAAESHGGMIDKFIGDAVLAVFGAPTAHEDDAERAVRAGLRILDEIAALNAADASLDLAVRVGINTGEVLARIVPEDATQGTVIGDVVNTASRLQTAAPVGSVIVSESTYQATNRSFDYRALDPLTVKGKSEPLRAWHALAPRARFDTEVLGEPTTPLVGHESEFRRLRRSLERSIGHSSVRAVVITGEPGIGKSRLVAELRRSVEGRPAPVRWREGRCLPYGEGVTFWALGEIVKAEAGIIETDDPATAGAKIDTLVADGDPLAPWLRARLRPLVGLEAPQAGREENFAAWSRFVASLAERRPTVIVIEDLHWADDSFLTFIEHVAEHVDEVPLLMILTARPELRDRAPAWLADASNAVRIDVQPLSEPETARLVSGLLESTALPAEVQATLLGRAGGNPLYAQEFVQLLKGRGILTHRGATWSLDTSAAIPVPGGIASLIAARLDTIPLERRTTLADASVLGQIFWSGAVASMGDADRDHVVRDLRELSRAGFVRPVRRSSILGEHEFAFVHALVRDACYGQIPRAARADKHVRAAAWLELVSGGRVEDVADILAAHCSTALHLARAVRAADTGDLEARTLRFLVLAGDRAIGIDVGAAERRYAEALELTPPGHAERPGVLAKHADALRHLGRPREAAASYEEAIQDHRAAGRWQALGVCMGRYASVLRWIGDPRSEEVIAEALTLLEAIPPSADLVRALTEQAGAALVSGDRSGAVAAADRAIAVAEGIGSPTPPRALGFRGAARAFLGDAAGLEDMRRAVDGGIAQALGREVGSTYGNLAVALASFEGPASALATAREGASFAERIGMQAVALSIGADVIDYLAMLGSYDQALAECDELEPRLREAEASAALFFLETAKVLVLSRRGAWNDALPVIERAAETARSMGEPQCFAVALPLVATVRLGLGDAEAACGALDELAAMDGVRGEQGYAARLVDAVRTALAADSERLATRLLEGFEPALPLYRYAMLNAHALIAEQAGKVDRAQAEFAEVATLWEGYGMPWERAQAMLGSARCLVALGRTREATGLLRSSRDLFARLGARPATAETDTRLRAIARIS